jgi:uncharacterized protein
MTTPNAAEPWPAASDTGDLAWMISQFAEEARGVLHALLLSADGLAIAASHGFDPDLVDKTAAIAGSLIAVADAMSREYTAGELEILTFRTVNMHFLLMSVADRAGLAVLADRDSNLGIVGHEMRQLVTAVGARLNPDPRSPLVPHPAATPYG